MYIYINLPQDHFFQCIGLEFYDCRGCINSGIIWAALEAEGASLQHDYPCLSKRKEIHWIL